MPQKYKYFLAIHIICLFFLPFGFAKGNELAIPDSFQLKLQQAPSDTAALKVMSEVILWMNSHNSALVPDYLAEFSQKAEKTNEPYWIAKSLNFYGIYYGRLPDYDKALAAYFQAITIFEQIDNKKGIAGACHNIGNIFEQTKDFKQALSYYQKAMNYNMQINNKAWLLKNYNGISVIYKHLGKRDSSLFYLEKSLALSEERKDYAGIMYANGNLGVFYLDIKDYKKAESYTKTAYLLSKEHHQALSEAQYAGNLGSLYMEMNRLAEAEFFLQAAISSFEKQKFKKHYEFCYQTLSELEEKKGNPTQALIYYKKYHALFDSLLTDEKNKAIQEYDIKYQSQKKEQENNLLRKENTIKGLQIYGLGFIAILLVLFIAYFYYINQKMKNKNALITQQKDELFAANQALNALLQEKDNIIATVSHDYRSPLGRIRAVVDLVMLQKENLSEKQQKHLQKIPVILAEATHLIDDLLDVTYIDRLTAQLHPETFEIKGELQSITEDYQHWIKQKELTLSYHFPPENCEIYTDRPAFKRIFDNLISNAIKYSHLNKNISFFIERKEKGYAIIIKDEGQGFSAEDKIRIFTRFQRLSAQPIAVGNSYGLGLSIVKTLVDGLGATIELEETEVGASFRICFGGM